VLKLFSLSAQNTSLHIPLTFKVSIQKSAVILMGFPLYVICFFSFTAFNILSLFSVLVVLMWGSYILVKSVWCPGDFLYLNEQNFLKIWKIFCCYFIEYVICPFCLHLFSFNGMILRFGLFMDLLSSCMFLSQLWSCLTKISSLISILFQTLRFSLPLVLVCWSGLPLCFLFD
jgi:hypothetical protein